jgi:hypothetical protein
VDAGATSELLPPWQAASETSIIKYNSLFIFPNFELWAYLSATKIPLIF